MNPLTRRMVVLLALSATTTLAHAKDEPITSEPAPTAAKTGPGICGTPCLLGDKLKVKGFVTVWATPINQGESASAKQEPFRIRFARVKFVGKPSKTVEVVTLLGLENSAVLFDVQATWKPSDALNVSAGQFRIPFGAALLTPATQLTMMDRPSFVYKMTKKALRDVGFMLHSGKKGLGDGAFTYNFGVFNGSGRFPVSKSTGPLPVSEYLFVARTTVDPAKALTDKVSTKIGLSYAHSKDGALDSGDAKADKALAGNYLGRTLTPFTEDRTTQLYGADFTVTSGGLSAQLEGVMLKSASATTEKTVMAGSAQVGYLLAPLQTQLAVRAEVFDPSKNDNDQNTAISTGVNYFPTKKTLVSVFWTQSVHPSATAVEDPGGYQLDGRFQAKF